MTPARAIEALADPTRRAVFERLRRGPLPVGKLAAGLDVTRPAVSQHLRLLREVGLVEVRREGRRRYYRARKETMGPIREVLEEMWVGRLKRLRDLAEEREKGEAR